MQEIVQVLPNDKASDVLQRVLEKGTREQIVLIALLSWNFWNRRNKWVWDKINMSVFGVRAAAMNAVLSML